MASDGSNQMMARWNNEEKWRKICTVDQIHNVITSTLESPTRMQCIMETIVMGKRTGMTKKYAHAARVCEINCRYGVMGDTE